MRRILTLLVLLVSLYAFPLSPAFSYYFQENGRWYFGRRTNSGNFGTEIVGIDVDSFRLISNSNDPFFCPLTPFAKDNNFVYHSGRQIEGANPQTWEIIFTEKVQRNLYSRDDRNVFFRGEKIESADRDTFEDISTGLRNYFYSRSIFGRDKNFVFRGAARTSYDVATFRELYRQEFTVDKLGVYYRDRLLVGSCFNDFRELWAYYTISNNRVFFKDSEIEDADANSFQVLAYFRGAPWFSIEHTIARDRNHIFINSQKFTEIDVEFAVIRESATVIGDRNGAFQIYSDWRSGIVSLVPIETE